MTEVELIEAIREWSVSRDIMRARTVAGKDLPPAPELERFVLACAELDKIAAHYFPKETFREFYARKVGESWPVHGQQWPRGIGQFVEQLAEATADWMDEMVSRS